MVESGSRLSELVVWGERFVVASFPVDAPAGLSPAEREVAGLAARGLSNRRIAAQRRTAERTVANQLSSIYRKLGVASRRELTAALSRGD